MQPVPQQMGYQQPTVNIVRQNAPVKRPDEFTRSAITQMKGLSVTQLLLGLLSIICGIVLISMQATYGGGSEWVPYISYGIWIGGYLLLLGGVGVGAAVKNQSCLIITAMVLNIVSAAVVWVVLLSLASVGLAETSVNKCNLYLVYYGYNKDCDSDSVHATFLAMDSILIVVALVELVVAIWSAVLCCGAVCACCKPACRSVQYSSTPGIPAHQNVIMYTTTTGAPGVPGAPVMSGAPGAHYHYPVQQQMTVQGPYPLYSAGAVPQPVGYMAQPQAPPTYCPAGQSEAVSNPGNVQPPSSTSPANPEPTKQ